MGSESPRRATLYLADVTALKLIRPSGATECLGVGQQHGRPRPYS